MPFDTRAHTLNVRMKLVQASHILAINSRLGQTVVADQLRAMGTKL